MCVESCWRRREFSHTHTHTLASLRWRWTAWVSAGADISFSLLLFQGVLESLQQRGHPPLLYEGHGGRHHPLWPRPPQRSLHQILHDRCKACRWFQLEHRPPNTWFLFRYSSSDQKFSKSPEGSACGQSWRPPQRPQVGDNLLSLTCVS